MSERFAADDGRPVDDHERFAEWDAAYVVGALDADDRLAFERHLNGCERCRASVAALAGVPALLGRVDAKRAAEVAERAESDATPAIDLLPRVEAAATRRRRRLAAIGGIAAAAVIAAAIVLPITLAPRAAEPDVVASLQPERDVPLAADVALTTVRWGTRVDVDCRYAAGEGRTWAYALRIVDDDGRRREVSSWNSGPGDEVEASGLTSISIEEIAAIELTDDSGDTVLLSADLE